MAYFTVYDGSDVERDGANPFDFGTLNRDTEEVSGWQYGKVLTDAGLESSGNVTVSAVDATGDDSSGLFQLAAFTTGDTTEPAATPEAYTIDLVSAETVDDTTGVGFWVRRKAGPAEAPATDTTAVIRVSGTVVPV